MIKLSNENSFAPPPMNSLRWPWGFRSLHQHRCLTTTNTQTKSLKIKLSGGGNYSTWALCVQMDFKRTFEANAKCNNLNFLVVLKYHRCPSVNIFDTDISRCLNTYIKVVYLTFFGIFMLL